MVRYCFYFSSVSLLFGFCGVFVIVDQVWGQKVTFQELLVCFGSGECGVKQDLIIQRFVYVQQFRKFFRVWVFLLILLKEEWSFSWVLFRKQICIFCFCCFVDGLFYSYVDGFGSVVRLGGRLVKFCVVFLGIVDGRERGEEFYNWVFLLGVGGRGF